MPTPPAEGPFLLEPVEVAAPAPPTPEPIGVVLGTNLAYEAVSLSTAQVVQDVGTLIRQFTAVSTAALAVATEKILEATAKEDAPAVSAWMTAATDVTKNLEAVAKVYGDYGAYAAIVKSYFVPGAAVPTPPTPPSSTAPPAPRSRG